MLGAPPQLWGWMCTHWVPVPAALSWLWWRSLLKAEDPLVVAWRQAFLDFDHPDRLLSRDLVEAFLARVATPAQLIALCEQLQAEGKLLRRDCHQLEELMLAHVDKAGQWKHHHTKGGRHGGTDDGGRRAATDAGRLTSLTTDEATGV